MLTRAGIWAGFRPSLTWAVVSVRLFFLQLAEVSRMLLVSSVEFVVVSLGRWGLWQRFRMLLGPSEAFLLGAEHPGGAAAGAGVSASVLGALGGPS